MKTIKRRMALSKETLRSLSAKSLEGAAGAASGVYTCAFGCVQYTTACPNTGESLLCGATALCGSLASISCKNTTCPTTWC